MVISIARCIIMDPFRSRTATDSGHQMWKAAGRQKRQTTKQPGHFDKGQ